MPSGRPKKRPSEDVADEFAQKLAAGINPRTIEDSGLSFPELVARFLREYRPRSGKLNYYVGRSKVWLAHFGDKAARGITVTDVDRFRAAREAVVGPSTVRKDLISLSTMFRWAKVRGLVNDNPAEPLKVKRPPEPKHRTGYLTEEEEARLIAAAPPWLRLVIQWGVNTGMDRSEILSLSWQDIDRQAGVVYAPRSKTGAPREIPINQVLRRILADAGRVRRTDTDRVFLGPEGQPVALEAARMAMRRTYRRAGIKAPPWKILRHTFGSRLAMAGVPAVTIARLMGHTTAAITDRYMHLSPTHLRDAMLRLANADGSIEAARPAPAESDTPADIAN
jgi:integrase